jgi:hypothetical protein
VGQWLRHGWHVAVGYVIGFFVMLVGLASAVARPPVPRTRAVVPAGGSHADQCG